MKQITISVCCILLVLTGSRCENEPLLGHIRLFVTYPEAVVEPDQPLSFIQVPANGAEVRLYDKDAQCWGIRDARSGVAWIDSKPTASICTQKTNEKGEALFNDLPAGEYYLVIYAKQLYKYTEKYVDVYSGDTLKLTKDFTADLGYSNDLEPWDYVMPVN